MKQDDRLTKHTHNEHLGYEQQLKHSNIVQIINERHIVISYKQQHNTRATYALKNMRAIVANGCHGSVCTHTAALDAQMHKNTRS